MIDQISGSPFFRRLIVAEITIARDDRLHSGGMACLDVAYVVAQINAVRGSDSHFAAGMRAGMLRTGCPY